MAARTERIGEKEVMLHEATEPKAKKATNGMISPNLILTTISFPASDFFNKLI
jgi:hypothetical protein